MVSESEMAEHVEVADEGTELFTTFWKPGYPEYGPRETKKSARILAVPEDGEPFFTTRHSLAHDTTINTSTAAVKVDGETYFAEQDSSLFRLETWDTDYYVPRDRIHRQFQVPRSGEGRMPEEMGFTDEADPR